MVFDYIKPRRTNSLRPSGFIWCHGHGWTPDQNLTEVMKLKTCVASCNDLGPNSTWAISWTKDYTINWRLYAVSNFNGLSHGPAMIHLQFTGQHWWKLQRILKCIHLFRGYFWFPCNKNMRHSQWWMWTPFLSWHVQLWYYNDAKCAGPTWWIM